MCLLEFRLQIMMPDDRDLKAIDHDAEEWNSNAIADGIKAGEFILHRL